MKIKQSEIKMIMHREQWDTQFCYNFNYITNDYKFVAALRINCYSDANIINSIYIAEEYRGNNLTKRLLKDMNKFIKNVLKSDVELLVRRDNFIYNTYANDGFEYDSDEGVYVKLIKKYR